MRISDWSSDVCSSDLSSASPRAAPASTTRTRTCSRETLRRAELAKRIPPNVQTSCGIGHVTCGGNAFGGSALLPRKHRGGGDSPTHPPPPAGEGARKSVVSGKRVSVPVVPGGG